MQIEGQCHCGLVTYEADIDPLKVSICHRTDCQALTGSPYRVTVICSGEKIRLTGKPPKIYAKPATTAVRGFSIFAGSAVLRCSPAARAGPMIGGFAGGSIRQRANLRPMRQIWCRSAAPWTNDLSELPGQMTERPASGLAPIGAARLNRRPRRSVKGG
jgi:hypothetical protein